jgi:hypothetical protein
VQLTNWVAPQELARYGLTADEQRALVQVLLSGIRLQKAIEFPSYLSSDRKEFKTQRGKDGFLAQGSMERVGVKGGQKA